MKHLLLATLLLTTATAAHAAKPTQSYCAKALDNIATLTALESKISTYGQMVELNRLNTQAEDDYYPCIKYYDTDLKKLIQAKNF